jgi:hypothetical protein
MEHVVIMGKTGTGKTSLIKGMIAQDVHRDRGFLVIDLHGDLTPFVLGSIVTVEKRTGRDLSSRTILVDPSSPTRSVGLNILSTVGAIAPLVTEVVSIFRKRWQLDHFGARTEELLRNSLWVLLEAGLTLTELAPFLTDIAFRAPLVQICRNAEVKAYFRDRYEQLSDAMQSVMREVILNKASAFTTDPAIRHMIGQTQGLNVSEALDAGHWVTIRLNKSTLGENSETLAALILARFQSAVYARKSRRLFTIYADEVQNLVSSGDTLEHLLSESRKFGLSLTSACQHLQQSPPQVRASLLSAGTSIFFRTSPEDAPTIARALDGGLSLERRLKELPNRRFLIRSGSDAVHEVQATEVQHVNAEVNGLIARSDARWAKARSDIEIEISARRGFAVNLKGKEGLEGWK